VVQLYVHDRCAKVVRPAKELKAFAKVALQPGEGQTVRFELDRCAFAYYDASTHGWAVNTGEFDLFVGGSCQDLPLKQTVEVRAAQSGCSMLTRNSLLKEFKRHPKGEAFYPQLAEAFGLGNPDEVDMMVRAFLDDMPLYKIHAFSEGRFTEQRLEDILKQVR
jgi:beta-glucosidase